MDTMTPEKIVIIDYSGTLSLEAPGFSRTDNLVRVLRETGLADLGVSTAEFFWNQIVDPTWVEGSTTAAGYSTVMTDRIEALGLVPAASRPEIAGAAARFVQTYLRHSRIDPHWRPVLLCLKGHPSILTIVATDHYREATDAVILFLESWGIAAVAAGARGGPGHGPPDGPSFLVANSADLGFRKADRRFWEHLALELPVENLRGVLLIDDFGFNEETGDRYSDRVKVFARKEETLAVLSDVFPVHPDVFPFFLEGSRRGEEAARARLVAEAGACIESFLRDDHGR